jgi:hypothetical protein
MLLVFRIIFIISNPEREKGFGLFVSIYLIVLIVAVWFVFIVLLEFDLTKAIQITLNIIFTSTFVYLLWDTKEEYTYMRDGKECREFIKRIKNYWKTNPWDICLRIFL